MAGYHVWINLLVAPPITDKTEMEGIGNKPLFIEVPSMSSGMAFVTSDKYPDLERQFIGRLLNFNIWERFRT